MKERLRNNADRADSSNRVCKALLCLPEFINASTILAFSPMHSEVDITSIYDDRFLFPYIGDGKMRYSTPPLEKGKMGFYEPKEKLDIDYEKAVILVPALAFSKDLRRLGRGGGFYDRYLEENRDKVFSIGLSFEMNLLDVIPYDHHDQTLDMIITEKRIITRQGQY